MRPDQVVVGVASHRARAVMTELYAPFVRTEQPVLFMDRGSAELTNDSSRVKAETAGPSGSCARHAPQGERESFGYSADGRPDALTQA